MKRLFAQSPVVESSPNIFNQSRLDLIKNSYKYAPIKYNFYFKNPQFDDIHPHIKRQLHIFLNPNQTPGTMHEMMFNTYIEWFGREQHKKLHLKKALDLQILGCYAQTQIAHGSDISSLQTTATFSKETQQWVINSPTIQAAKFWPGDMGIVAQYAIVFAQAIVDSKSKGVFPYLVQIKDKDYNWMPGIDGGDIGPKIGFHTNENGFMLFNNVRIPRDDLINKYVQISQNGEIKNVGDPRVGFGAMMHVRQLITCVAMRNYAIPITIAVRYSLFRRQFRNGQKEEISIIEYQTQQDKILPRIAEYYAMSTGGTKIRLCSQANTALIQKRDFSLLQETHANLALGKCLYTELVTDGCQILRRSVGGHGTSHYSGIPSVWSQSLANIPGEGQNTVMYIQTARYVMKNYLALLKGEPVAESLKYVSELGGVSDLQLSGKQEWTLKELRLTLLRGLQFVLGVVMSRLQSKSKEESTIDVMNHKLGNRLQQLAQLHAVIFTANAFVADIDAETHPSAKPILNDLCKLFMIGQIQRLSSPIIEAAFICPTKFALLEEEKQRIFARLRPIIVGLTDSLAIPEKYIRSQLARGHPYNNFLDAARQNDLNHGIQESQRICGNIAHVLAKQLPKL